uniref:Serine proteinase n=1 Tax=Samia ricini TaxID=63990 RepID=A1IIA6_SAMRI|nr:serine proteinase [Samia ricini]
MDFFTKSCFLFLLFVGVNSMSLKGPALTRYDPCGLGIIYFDRLAYKHWQGVVNFGLYNNLIEAEMEIYFEKEVRIIDVSQNTSFLEISNNRRDFVIKPNGPIPKNYFFHLSVENLNGNENDVPVVSRFVLNNVTLCNDVIKASQTINSLNVTSNYADKYYAHVCGRRSLERTELVSVRTESKPGDWPWHVAILIRDVNTNIPKYDCGGSIISRTSVVTAGHCVFKKGVLLKPFRFLVVAGTNNYKDLNQIGRQALTPLEVWLHPNYNDDYSAADLAIMKFNRFEYTEYVQPICLWGPVYDKTNLFGKEATVVGFGSTEANRQSDILRSANTMVQEDTVCVNFEPNVYRKLMNEFTFCAGYGPESAINPRNGDSGGGLIVRTIQPDHKVSWFLRGVLSKCGVSPGQTECDPTYYVVFTDVGPHYGWIYHHSGLEFRNNVNQ